MSDREAVIAQRIAELGQAKTQCQAADALLRLGHAAVPTLLRAWSERNHQEAAAIAAVLRRIGEATPELAPLLPRLRLESWRGQLQAARAVAALGEVGAVALPDLEPLLNSDREKLGRVVVAALERFGPLAAVALRSAYAKMRYDHRAAVPLLDAAARLGPDPDVVELLAGCLAGESEARHHAADLLARLGLSVVGRVIDAFERCEWDDVRWSAPSSVLAALVPQVFPLLAEALTDTGRSYYVRSGILNTLNRLAEEGMVHAGQPGFDVLLGALIRLVDDADEQLRGEALWTLAKLGPAAAPAVPRLLQALEDSDTTAVQALAALAVIGPAARAAVPQARQMLESRDEWHRRTAEWYLAAMGDPDTLDRLRRQLNDPCTFASAFDALQHFLQSRPEVVIPLLGDALHSDDAALRLAAVSAFSRLRYSLPEQINPLLQAVLADPDRAVRLEAVRSLKTRGHLADSGVRDLLRVAQSDPDDEVRHEAVGAFQFGVRIRTPEVFAVLRQALRDPHQLIRRTAEGLLCDWPWFPEEALPDLVPCLNSPDAEPSHGFFLAKQKLSPGMVARVVAALRATLARHPDGSYPDSLHALATFDYTPTAEDLPWLLQPFRETPARLSHFAIPLVARLGAPAVPELVALLDRAHSDLANAIAQALGEIGPAAAAAVPALRPWLDRPKTRVAAAGALGRLGQVSEAIAVLRPHLDDRTPHGSGPAVQALRRLGPEVLTLLPKLMELVRDIGDVPVGDGLMHLLAELAGYSPEVVKQLRAALRYPHFEAVAYAATTLGAIGPAAAEAVPDLIDLLRHPEEEVPRAAAAALGNLGPAAGAAVAELTRCLREPDEQLYCNALVALGKLGPVAAPAIPDVLPFLDRPDVGQCLVALTTLGNIGPGARDVLPVLRRLTGHQDSLIRQRAAEVLGKIESAGAASGVN